MLTLGDIQPIYISLLDTPQGLDSQATTPFNSNDLVNMSYLNKVKLLHATI